MDEKQNIFDRYVMLMDQNIKGIQVIILLNVNIFYVL